MIQNAVLDWGETIWLSLHVHVPINETVTCNNYCCDLQNVICQTNISYFENYKKRLKKNEVEQFFKNYHYNKFFIIFDLVHLHVYHNNIVFAEILKGYLTVWGGYYCLFISPNLLARFGYFSWISSFKVHMGIYTYLIIVIKFSPSKQTIQNDYQFF